MEDGFLRPDAISLQDVLISATDDITRMATVEREDQQPPPYQSQASHTQPRVSPPQLPATMITARSGQNNSDIRYLVAHFPGEGFWVKKATESNKDFYRRVCRFMFQGKFCTYYLSYPVRFGR